MIEKAPKISSAWPLDKVLMRDRTRSRWTPTWLLGKTPVNTTYGDRRHVKQINQYQLLTAIGEGSSSRVFLAKNTQTSQIFAVKRLRMKQLGQSGAQAVDWEIRHLARLKHQNVVCLHEVIYVQPSQTVYLVLDHADCGNLEHLVKSGFNLTPNDVSYIFKQVVNAVRYLHQNGVVHQDLKPQNILLARRDRVLISDFGNAHHFGSSPRAFGTPAYQAPELIYPLTEVDCPGAEDIWSLGVTLYFLAFRELPFQGSNVYEITKSIISTTLSRPATCDDVLWDLIVKMLTVNPKNRIGIEDVWAHDYVRNATNRVEREWSTLDVAPSEPNMPVTKVQGIVCTNGLELAMSTLRTKQFQAPFAA
jgi:serine/threonine protein kinase